MSVNLDGNGGDDFTLLRSQLNCTSTHDVGPGLVAAHVSSYSRLAVKGPFPNRVVGTTIHLPRSITGYGQSAAAQSDGATIGPSAQFNPVNVTGGMADFLRIFDKANGAIVTSITCSAGDWFGPTSGHLGIDFEGGSTHFGFARIEITGTGTMVTHLGYEPQVDTPSGQGNKSQ